MKRIICTILLGAFLLSFAGCDVNSTSTSNTDKTKATTTTETSFETTTESVPETTVAVPINASLIDIERKILSEHTDTTEIIGFQKHFPETAEENRSRGVVDYCFIGWLGVWKTEEERYFMSYNVFILEYDMNSEFFKCLRPGEEVSFLFKQDQELHLRVAAINGQYVLCMTAGRDDDHYEERKPEYTLGYTPEIYRIFTEMK